MIYRGERTEAGVWTESAVASQAMGAFVFVTLAGLRLRSLRSPADAGDRRSTSPPFARNAAGGGGAVVEVVAMENTKLAREFLEAWHWNKTSINPHVDLDAHYEGTALEYSNLILKDFQPESHRLLFSPKTTKSVVFETIDMSIEGCRNRPIELMNPVQVAPPPGELEIFPRVTLRQEGILDIDKLHRELAAEALQQQPAPDKSGGSPTEAAKTEPGQRFMRQARLRRARSKLARFRTQPITFAEIAEADEEEAAIALPSSSSNFNFASRSKADRQIDGVAMGSPLGPLLADVVMGKLERFQLSDQIKKLKHYGRYVDDIFAIATTETDVAALLNAANQAHPSIKFTLEMESAGSLPFLDVLLNRRSDGSIRRSVYRKKTWSGQYTNFASFVPLQQKRNLVRCLAQRARKICSTDSIEEELRKIQDLLRENGYPDRFIAKNLAERPAKPATLTAEKKTLFLKVPF
ncbi:hypothetical protein SprV_0802608900 [Sparganum proliferum]